MKNYLFTDKNFVEALSNPINIKNFHFEYFQLLFQDNKNGTYTLKNNKQEIESVSQIILNIQEIKNIDWIWNFTNLTNLELCRNDIENIPDEIWNLTNLKSLDLSDNMITKIPSSVLKLTNLQELDLNCNDIKTIPNKILNLSKLKVLDLSDNKLKNVPNNLKEIKKIDKFSI